VLLTRTRQAVLATELGLMVDTNGGGFIWVHRAWGPFVGWVNGWNGMLSSYINIGLLVTLFPSYFPIAASFWERFGLSVAFVVVTMGINIVGFRWVSRVSGLIMVLLFSPFFCALGWEIATGRVHTMNWSSLAEVPSWDYVSPNMSSYVGTVVWAFGGFDSLGSIAGEIEGGKKTFFMGLLLCMPLLLLNYTFPLVVTFPLDSNVTQWGLSSSTLDLTKVLHVDGTEWLWILAVTGALAATFAQLSSAIMSFSRVIWAASKSTGKYKHYPTIVSDLSWLRHTGTIRPIASIFVAGGVGVLLTLMEFSVIVQLYLVARIVNLIALYSSLIRLRLTEPHAPRPFRVPGGMVALCLLGAPTVLISSVAMYFAQWQVWAISGVAEAVIIVSFVGRHFWLKRFGEDDVLFGDPPSKQSKGDKHKEEEPRDVGELRAESVFLTGSIQN
jgi:amino acid transporter